MSLANVQGKLSRAEMKKIMAGSGGTSGCCAHDENWAHYQCGYSSAQEAQAAASLFAQQNGVRAWYCCDCSSSPGFPG